MSDEPEMRTLFNRWSQVWHEDRYDLIPVCVAPTYIRHGSFVQSAFTVTYTPEEYARVVAAERQRSQLRFAIHDHAFTGDRAWLRLTLFRTDPDTGHVVSRAAIQVYRLVGGKLAETWVCYQGEGSAWPEDGEEASIG